MLVEAFALSGLYATGSVMKYFYTILEMKKSAHLEDNKLVEVSKEPVKKFVEMSVEEVEQESPIYIHTGGGLGGFAVPVLGGTTRQLKTVLTSMIPSNVTNSEYNFMITDFKARPCGLPRRFWLNTPEDLKDYLAKNNIPHNSAPLALPIHVCEIQVPKEIKVYKIRESNVAGTHMETVIKTAVHARTLGRRSFVGAASFAILSGAFIWDDFRRGKYVW